MPEIKNTFVGGRMNKDLDERIIPKGEYRDAMNIQIGTSEGSDIGTVQNILGNLSVENIVPDKCKCVGAVADEKNNALYWLIAGPTYLGLNDTISKDLILQYKDNVVTPVVVDIYRMRTSYGNHDSTASTILVPNGANYNLEIGMVAQFDDAYAQISYFGNNPITAVSAPDQYGNVTVTLANSNTVTLTTGYANPELQPDSGNIVYLENRKPIQRASDQTEDIKIIIEI